MRVGSRRVEPRKSWAVGRGVAVTPSRDGCAMQIREDIDARIAALAAIQHGVIARGQVLSCGGSRSLIDRRVRAHRWEPVHPGVYAVVGSPASFERDVWAAHLAVGAHSVVTHELALSLAGVQRVPRRPLTFTVPHGGHARTHGAFVHQIDDLRPHHVRLSAGLPVSTPARAVVEVASTFGSKHLGTVLDEVVIERRLTSYPQISAVLSEVARPGKRGVTGCMTTCSSSSRSTVGVGTTGSVHEGATTTVTWRRHAAASRRCGSSTSTFGATQRGCVFESRMCARSASRSSRAIPWSARNFRGSRRRKPTRITSKVVSDACGLTDVSRRAWLRASRVDRGPSPRSLRASSRRAPGACAR